MVAGLAGPVAPTDRAAAATLAVDTLRPEPGPLGPITVVGDSVLLGSALYAPTLVDQLAASGWGPIRFRAAVGMFAGTPGTGRTDTAAYWIERWRREGWDTTDVVLNIGANDSGNCGASVACNRSAIERLLDAIGPGHRIWWPLITRFPAYGSQRDAWNAALDQVAAERDDMFVWDWPTVMYADGQYVWDHTHLTPTGYRNRSARMALEVTADLARATRSGDAASPPAPAGAASELVPIPPTRALDTRDPGRPGRLAAGDTVEVDLSGIVPDGAVAAAIYVTAASPADRGFLTAYDCERSRPLASTVSMAAGTNRGAVALAPLTDGRFCVYAKTATDVVVDVQAAFVPGEPADGLRFTPSPEPFRVLDSRETGRARVHRIDVPGAPTAVSVAITAVDGDEPGFLAAYACDGPRPTIATVNHRAHEVVSGWAYVPLAEDGSLCVFARSGVDVTVDVTGTFTADGDLSFVPAAPTRMVDTRDGTGGWAPIQGQRQTLRPRVAPADAEAVSGTITIVRPLRQGHLRAWSAPECEAPPTAAAVTAVAGEVLANHLSVGVTDGELCVYARSATSTVFDTSGWWVRP